MLRNVTWQLHQPASHQRLAVPPLVTPAGLPASRTPWSLAPYPYGVQYGAVPHHSLAMLQAGQQ
ncbi:hypothetical protein E2C01_100226 [Portunus trituberculatus]|uniref:Uncharacterized protein n=1 Tax=Portunus trituberculatus TaxID=210409 RepID=A0A5B7K680_PORTR|nr:hypothetical protein [Portunus trituberculatus]